MKEELSGENGKYGLLRQVENHRYALNFILFDKNTIEKAQSIYTEQLPAICRTVTDYIEEHKEEYLAFPYLNKRADLNLILWQQISVLAGMFQKQAGKILSEKYFAQTEKPDRPFSVFGYVDNGKYYGAGWDGVTARNICGFSRIYLDNIYCARINPHFHCGLNVANDEEIQLALRAIDGLLISTLSEVEREHAAKAVECGYLYREGEKIYTKILVNHIKDSDRLFEISNGLSKGYLEAEAQKVAEQLYKLIRTNVPKHLLGEWRFANNLAGLPVLDSLVESLIEKGILTPPG